MNWGQKHALHELHRLETEDRFGLEIMGTAEADGWLDVIVTMRTDANERTAGGLELRGREEFLLRFGKRYPYEPPEIAVRHDRFAGHPHVFWGRVLCMFRSKNIQWNPSGGMDYFMAWLSNWLMRGARNELDPLGQPIHPPSAVKRSGFAFVPKVNNPQVKEGYWLGYAHLESISESAAAVVGWHRKPWRNGGAGAYTPVILLSQGIPWHAPERWGELVTFLASAGVSTEVVLGLMEQAIGFMTRGERMFIVLGAPQRGDSSDPSSLKQHLMVWEVPIKVPLAYSRLKAFDDPTNPLSRELFSKGMQNVPALVSWCPVMEQRPEIVMKRDAGTPMEFFRGKHVALWGCGALGSHAAYLLAKSGVKQLSIVDDAAVSAGALERQHYAYADINKPKVEALHLGLRVIDRALRVSARPANILDLLEDGTAFDGSPDVIVDCTASEAVHAKLETLKGLSSLPDIPIVSMAVGKGADRGLVVLAPADDFGSVKTVYRKAKLVACTNSDLIGYLDDLYPTDPDLSMIQPEPGCSEPTFAGSVADVAGLSAGLLNAAAILLADGSSKAKAVFQAQAQAIIRDGHSKGAFLRCVFERDQLVQCEGFKVLVSERALSAMQAEREHVITSGQTENETGGMLWGRIDESVGCIWIDDASGPPPGSQATPTSFICGTTGVEDEVQRRVSETRGSMTSVGMWHTHPNMPATPSAIDHRGMRQILSESAAPRQALMLILGTRHGDDQLSATLFERRMKKGELEVVHVPTETVRIVLAA